MDTPSFRADSDATGRLLLLASQGETCAIEQLLAQHRDEMRRFVDLHLDRSVRPRLDPSDVVQDAQLEMARRLSVYLARRPMPFHVWARKTAYERLLNAQRNHKASRRAVSNEVVALDHSSQVLADRFVASGPSPSEVAAVREQAERVAAVVTALPEADREILLLRLVDGLPHDEIACLLEITPLAARQRYGRALVRLQAALERIGVFGDAR
jgi:RNA polymerase sigma-70 factor, ECF subfamily